MILRSERFSAFDRVGGVDHFADIRRKGEERNDVLPCPPPGRPDRRITLAPLGFEVLKPEQSGVGILGMIDSLDRRQDRLAIFPGHEGQAVADQMHDAGLDHRLGEDAGSNDTMLPDSNAYFMFKHLKNAQMTLYPDAGHGALFQYPERFVNHAGLFLSE
jgi:hypothetical protein